MLPAEGQAQVAFSRMLQRPFKEGIKPIVIRHGSRYGIAQHIRHRACERGNIQNFCDSFPADCVAHGIRQHKTSLRVRIEHLYCPAAKACDHVSRKQR